MSKHQQQALFERHVNTIARRLSSEQGWMPDILQHHSLLPLQHRLDSINSYESLFLLLVATGTIAAEDFSVLTDLLAQMNRGDLLASLSMYLAADQCKDAAVQLQADCRSEFRFLLHSIGSSISTEQLKEMLFLVRDLLPRHKMDSVEDPHELLELVRQRDCIHWQQPCFLQTLLQDTGREDLCREVDMYVYQHLSPCHLQSPPVPCTAGETKSWFKGAYHYRVLLKQLADKLESSDLDSMKHMCTGMIPKAKLERVTHTLDLFLALEDYGKLSNMDVSILEDILPEKTHFLRPLHTQLGLMQSRETQETQHQAGPCLNQDYMTMLRRVGQELTRKEVRELISLQDKRSNATAAISTGFQLLNHWEEMDLVTHRRTEFLQKCLAAIGRNDLKAHAITYQHAAQLKQTSFTQAKPEEEPHEKTAENTIMSTHHLPWQQIITHKITPAGNQTSAWRGSGCCRGFASDTSSNLSPSTSNTSSDCPTSDALVEQLRGTTVTIKDKTHTNNLQGEVLELHQTPNHYSEQLQRLEQKMKELEDRVRRAEKNLTKEKERSSTLEHVITAQREEIDQLREANQKLHLLLCERNKNLYCIIRTEQISTQSRYPLHTSCYSTMTTTV